MGKIKVFLASSSELKEERDSFARFIRQINEVMKLQNTELEAEQWEFKEKAIQGCRLQDMYNKTLANCEICFVLFWKRCGIYTQEELTFAYNKFLEGQNPKKIYVFFKQYDENNTPEILKNFRKDFPKKFNENFAFDYSSIGDLWYLSFLEISRYLSSDVTQLKFNNHLIDFSKLPCFIHNKYNSEILDYYKKLSAYSEKYPDDELFKQERESYETKLTNILADVINTAKQINEHISNQEVEAKDDNKALIHFYQQCQYDEVKKIIESVDNPFKTYGDISPEFFCDRIKECESIAKHILNGENILLIAPRRSGKTVFFRNRMRNSSSLSNSHYFVYCDLYPVRDFRDFTLLLVHRINEFIPQRKNLLKSIIEKFKSLTPTISVGCDGTPSLSLGFSESYEDPTKIIEDCFSFIEGLDKPCVLCFDEFQQASFTTPLGMIEQVINDYMDKLKNVRFVFIGSPRFYSKGGMLGIKNSIIEKCTFFTFEPIRKEDYQIFAQHWFRAYSKEIEATAFSYIYDFCQKSPYYIQRVLSRLFVNTKTGEICNLDKVPIVIDSMIRESAQLYDERIRYLTDNQRKVLYCFSKARHVSDLPAFKKQLISLDIKPSQVHHIFDALIDRELISYYDGDYYIEDVFFGHYLNEKWRELRY